MILCTINVLCDGPGCASILPLPGAGPSAQIVALMQAGWHVSEDAARHLCPACRLKQFPAVAEETTTTATDGGAAGSGSPSPSPSFVCRMCGESRHGRSVTNRNTCIICENEGRESRWFTPQNVVIALSPALQPVSVPANTVAGKPVSASAEGGIISTVSLPTEPGTQSTAQQAADLVRDEAQEGVNRVEKRTPAAVDSISVARTGDNRIGVSADLSATPGAAENEAGSLPDELGGHGQIQARSTNGRNPTGNGEPVQISCLPSQTVDGCGTREGAAKQPGTVVIAPGGRDSRAPEAESEMRASVSGCSAPTDRATGDQSGQEPHIPSPAISEAPLRAGGNPPPAPVSPIGLSAEERWPLDVYPRGSLIYDRKTKHQ